MGEILRAVLDESAMVARPRWYVGKIPWATYVAGQPLSGNIHIQANTNFLWTTFDIQAYRTRLTTADRPFIQFIQRESGMFYSDEALPAQNLASKQNSPEEFPEYPLLPGDFRLGFTLIPRTVQADNAYYLIFGGIEYLMPKAQSAYGIPVLGG